jgi:large subunit ribosomal protein L30
MAKKAKMKILKITLVRSPIGNLQRQKDTARALGLTRLHKTVTHMDTEAVRGMAGSIRHLLEIEEGEA